MSEVDKLTPKGRPDRGTVCKLPEICDHESVVVSSLAGDADTIREKPKVSVSFPINPPAEAYDRRLPPGATFVMLSTFMTAVPSG